YVSGIAMTVRNTGMAYSILLQSTSPSPRAINTPTMISAGAVTAGVTTPSSGEKNRASRNSTDVATDVNPVRPPAATPADDSTYAVVVDVPSTAPPIAATESDTNAARALGSLPSRSRPAWPAMAISVPDVSKKSTNIIVKITTSISPTNRSGKLVMAWPNVGARLGTPATTPEGGSITPSTTPTRPVSTMPSNTAPRTPSTSSHAVATSPNSASTVSARPRTPSATNVESSATTTSALRSPTNAMNAPIPAPVA